MKERPHRCGKGAAGHGKDAFRALGVTDMLWYMRTPHFFAPEMVVSVRVMEFAPSMTAASDPDALMEAPVTLITPVE